MKTYPKLFAGLAAGALLGVVTTAAHANPPADGQYRLRNYASGKCLDNLGATGNGATIAQWQYGTSNNQKWNLTTSGGNRKLQAVTGGRMLDSLGNTADGSAVGQWANGGSLNQQWIIEDAFYGFWKVVNVASGKAVDTGGQTANGSVMQFWPSGTSHNQRWSLEDTSPGVTFYENRSYVGAFSQRFGPGNYTTAQMIAKGCPDNWADSLKIAPGYSATCYVDDNFGGNSRLFTQNDQVMAQIAPGMSSVKVQAGVPAGNVYKPDWNFSGGTVEFQPGYIFGDWLLFFYGSWVQLKSSGGTCKYTVRYETEYWVGSGPIAAPTVQVITGTNVLYATSGTSAPGTCTGTAFPQEAYYQLNGEVKWTNNELGCKYNLAIRNGGI